jgi:hypothetical protein
MSTRTADFASAYTRAHRIYEYIGIAIGAKALLASVCWMIASKSAFASWTPLAIVLGIIGADFGSGMIHWACDTWGTMKTPILGGLVIRAFREHHVDAKSITRHDFVETNGHNITLSALPASFAIYALHRGSPFVAMTLCSMAFFVAMTSQIHKWAHMSDADRPRIIRLLQRTRVFITETSHDLHHTAPNDGAYCITVGWLNPLLDSTNFFRALEWAIIRVTGWTPRPTEE